MKLQLLLHTGSLLLLINAILYLKASATRKSLNLFTAYLWTIFMIQGLSFLLAYYKMNNLYLSHFYFIVQFILLSLFYREVLVRNVYKKLVTAFLALVLGTLSLQYVLQPGLYYTFNIFEIVLTSLSLVAYSILYFYESLGERKKLLYINSGIFLYLLSSTLLFASGNIMPGLEKKINKFIWIINAVLYIIYQVLIFMEWYKNLNAKERTL